MKKVMFLLLTFVFLYSCQETEFSKSDKITSDYLPMSIGNYWVYQEFIINPDGTEEATQVFDSIYIKGDTIINGKRYFEFTQNDIITSLVRDSSGCLVLLKMGTNNNLNPYVIFSEYNLTDTLYKDLVKSDMDTLYTITIRMEKVQQPISVPAGNFEVLNAKQTIICNSKITNHTEPIYSNVYYAKKVGEIFYSAHSLNWLGSIEYRLIRYSIIDN